MSPFPTDHGNGFVCQTTIPTSLGAFEIHAGSRGVSRIGFPAENWTPEPGSRASLGEIGSPDAHAEAARGQLAEYFAGERREFDLDLELRGSALDLRVWAGLREIPYGETISYGELTRRIGLNPTDHRDVRSVGAANGRNPVPVVIPCHRVISVNGGLVGYRGGLAIKRHLLELEAATLGGREPEPDWDLRQTSLM